MIAANAQTVTGNVSDQSGEPIIGASVTISGTTLGGVTDFDGNFTIHNVAKDAKLSVSYIGYESQTIAVAGRSSINVVLVEKTDMLDEVVVVGYGTQKRSDLTGAVSSVNTAQLNAKGAPTVLSSLQGSTPGVNITQSSARAGGSFDIEIRGKSSINSDTKPLYVVDGVQTSDIDFLNPQDIERVDVLKDASSTAIYGSRATAGVVMITTKSGAGVAKDKDAKPTISYDGYYGISKVARTPDFMDGQEFYNYRFMKFLDYAGDTTNPGSMPTYKIGGVALAQCLLQQSSSDSSSPYVMKQMLAAGNTYDWPSLVTQDGQQQNHYLAVSGATQSISYHFGLGYNQEKGIYDGDDQKRITFKGSVDAKLNKIVTAGFSMNFANIQNSYANDEAIQYAYRMNPYMVPYDENGVVNHNPGNKVALGCDDYQFSDQSSPLDLMKDRTKERKTWRILGNVYLNFDLMKGLSFKTTFSPNFQTYRQGQFTGYENPNKPGYTYNDKELSADGSSTAVVTNYTQFGWTWDNMINFNRTFNADHNVSLMGLISLQGSNSEKYVNTAYDVLTNTDWWNISSGSTSSTMSSSYGENSMVSYAFRANYNWKNRYYFTGTVRWDGSSKFDKDYRWGSFPSLALAWRITEEDFMQNAKWISNLKLRLSYGVTGNNTGVGNYDTQQTVSGPVYYPFNGTYVQGYYPSSIVDKLLQWEKSTEYNAGLDFGFLRDRITGSVEVYQKTSKDLLYEVQLPLVSGGGTMFTNVGKVQNRGIEASLTTVNIQNKDWNWTTTFTFAHNKNKVKEINGLADMVLGDETSTLIVGSSINGVYGYEWDGIVSDKMMTVPDNDIAKSKGLTPGSQMSEADYYYTCYKWTEGQPIIVDRNGDGKFDDNDKKMYSSDPVWTGSLTSNLSYKNWDFSFTLYSKQNYTVSSNFMSEYLNLSDRGRNKLQADFYIPAGTLLDCDGVNADGTYINPVYQATTHYGSYPFPNNGGSGGGVGNASEYWNSAKKYVDASYVKVKNITLGYTFSKSLLKHIGCKQFRLYATVTNPFVFTSYKGFDPEWANASNKQDGPSTITYQIGANIKF
jgi:TonB-linked SusC/RagA family outer membrane protein